MTKTSVPWKQDVFLQLTTYIEREEKGPENYIFVLEHKFTSGIAQMASNIGYNVAHVALVV